MTTDSRKSRRPAKLDDVARLAQVAKSTVSRVLGGEKTLAIRPETRQRVLDAIAALGYRPDARARGLRTKRSLTIGLVVPEIDNFAFTTIIQGAQRAALARGYTLLIAFTETAHPDRALYRRLVHDNQVDGLLVTTIRNPELNADLEALDIPLVLVNRELGPGKRAVIVDYRAGAQAAVMALIRLGHRRIGYLSGPLQNNYPGERRLAGVTEAHAVAGLRFDPSLMRECDYSRAGAAEAASRLFELPDGPPTALCAANTVIAAGILAAAAARGLSVPRDLSLVALLDAPTAEMLTPTVSAVQFPFFALGQTAADDLIDAIEDARAIQPTKVLPPTGLVVRESMGPCNAGPPRIAVRALPLEPWKNGAGVLQHIAAGRFGPAESTRDPSAREGFDWQLSLATLEKDAPFSHFPDIDRISVLAAPGPVVLTGPEAVLHFDRPGDIHRYAGEGPLACSLPAGETRFFNIALARGRATARVAAHRSAGRMAPEAAPVRLVFAAQGGCALVLQAAGGMPATRLQLAAGDAIRLDGETRAIDLLPDTADTCVVDVRLFDPATASSPACEAAGPAHLGGAPTSSETR
ncbi:substrate-binding domain-containing protein [Xylophilus rhododendri]|uniref:Substrate-binding domain-containing protein n=1 Tax=Xylophilus rhododendri TaxID=2697032 RepID=A0A857J1P1_9BURK|nr:HutD family protein [Xylophilus rhododendri]QHI97810.1 substrate-binding domain-containing protein [Xylophilus rhododendri]